MAGRGLSGRYFIRPMLRADLAELTDLWIESWSATFPAIDFEARRGWFVNRIVDLDEQGAAVLAAFDSETGAMAGFVAIDPRSHWLDQLAVAPAYAGRGAAADLMSMAEAAAGERIVLDVNLDNHRALRFYQKRGFVRVGEGTNPVSGLNTVMLEWRRAAQDKD